VSGAESVWEQDAPWVCWSVCWLDEVWVWRSVRMLDEARDGPLAIQTCLKRKKKKP
jgi:hypothetical protein